MHEFWVLHLAWIHTSHFSPLVVRSQMFIAIDISVLVYTYHHKRYDNLKNANYTVQQDLSMGP